ncbi:MAG: putative peptidoglycan glycosyltransferase FtsW [Eubacteriales bacterium]|jgi:cell division protein FtsW|nr:cell division protein FtsW [Clostridiales bacterium]
MNSGQKEIQRQKAGQNQSHRRVKIIGTTSAAKNQAKSSSGVAVKSYDAAPPTSVGYGTARAKKTKASTPLPTQVNAQQERAVAPTNATASEGRREYIRVKVAPDRIMIVLILLLVSIGSVVVFSASYPYALSRGLDSYYYVRRQIVFVALGLFVMAVIMRLPHTLIKRCAPIVYGVAFVLLIVVLFIGVSEGAARRWIYIKGAGITIQPSEIMKAGLVMMLAWYIDRRVEDIQKGAPTKRRLIYGVIVPGAFIVAACGLVLLEKHLSGTLILFIIGAIVMFIGGSSVGWMSVIFGALGISSGTAYLLANPYALQRVLTFLDENADKLDEEWQTYQGLLAIGSGGLFGLGLGESRQKFSYISQPQNDYIFTVWCEEMGYIGAITVILIFIVFIWRGFTIAMRAPDTFSSLTVFGIISHVAIQAILNVAVVTDTIPNTGISLPFFSYGGSSLIILLAEMGVVLSISRYSRQRKL